MGGEGNMAERRHNGLGQPTPSFFYWKRIWKSQCSIKSSLPQTMKYSRPSYKLEMILQKVSNLECNS